MQSPKHSAPQTKTAAFNYGRHLLGSRLSFATKSLSNFLFRKRERPMNRQCQMPYDPDHGCRMRILIGHFRTLLSHTSTHIGADDVRVYGKDKDDVSHRQRICSNAVERENQSTVLKKIILADRSEY